MLAIIIASTTWTVRHVSLEQVRDVWAEAVWWERAAMLLMIVPIPGPVDELIAGAVIVRVTRRVNGR